MDRRSKTPRLIVKTIPVGELPAAIVRGATIIGPKKGPRSVRSRSGHRSEQHTKIRIMIVDDDARVANSLMAVLNLSGYECYGVYNPADAIAAAESFQPDIVLSDVMMPGINGIELCEQIKQMLPACRVLLLSGEVSTAHTLIQDSRKHGYNFELLAKPVRPQELVAKIEHLFGGAYSPVGTQAANR
jgi:DNA-binding response OmpR family regulator